MGNKHKMDTIEMRANAGKMGDYNESSSVIQSRSHISPNIDAGPIKDDLVGTVGFVLRK